MLEGEAEFTIDGEAQTVGAGSYVAIPDGAVHSFHATGSQPARLLIMNAPGHMHEKFFTETGKPVDEATTTLPQPDGPPDVAHILSVAAASGMVILPPPH